MRPVRQEVEHRRWWVLPGREARLTCLTACFQGLSVHMNQVHKESLSTVENALPNRSGLEVEIFGMEGVPEDIVQQHNQRIIQNYYQAQADRRAATGNPAPGQSGGQGPAKKLKVESAEELKKRLAAHRAASQAAKANGGIHPAVPPRDGQSPSSTVGLVMSDLLAVLLMSFHTEPTVRRASTWI
jgi:hypothetical protein